MTTSIVQLTDEQWKLELNDYIDSLPEEQDVMTAFDLGVLDAECGNLCVPEQFFARMADMVEYAKGHESVVGCTPLSNQIMGRVDKRQLTLAEMEAETEDYESDILDREYHARGQW